MLSKVLLKQFVHVSNPAENVETDVRHLKIHFSKTFKAFLN